MSLSNDLVSKFVKTTIDEGTAPRETTVYGTTVVVDGTTWVKLDGSDLLTPISTTAVVKDGERVTVMIKDHSAIITGNITSPSANSTELDQVMGHELSTEELRAIIATIDSLQAKVGMFENVEAAMAHIETLRAMYVEATHISATDIEAINAVVETLQASFGEFTGITTDQLEAMNADITNLRSYNAEFTYVSAEQLQAVKAIIKELSVDKLESKYANIDFANIGEAAIKKIFGETGIIKDLVVGDQTIAGELVGVTISGDLIKSNTVMADKLVIKGDDGLYYKLNINALGETTAGQLPAEEQEALKNGLHGSNIIAKTITAEKITVKDLVAFGATIGGYHITNSSIYSGVKSSVTNTTRGVYLDSDGQFAVGDSSNYMRFHQDSNGNYILEISAESLKFSKSGQNVEESMDALNLRAGDSEENIEKLTGTTDDLGTRVGTAETDIGTLTSKTDEIDGKVDTTNEALGLVKEDILTLDESLDGVKNSIADWEMYFSYIRMGEDENGAPCIELGKYDEDFKLIITNEKIQFVAGSTCPAYITNESLRINKAVIDDELEHTCEQGSFVWKTRSNGNLGLIWKGGTS